LVALIQAKRDDTKLIEALLYHGESWDLMARRWGKLEKDFKTKGHFDVCNKT
jgi:inositol hexakisphosphate/diphosphoinositol-pentakisphosphate kinase